MQKIDNIISIIMVFVTAIGFAQAVELNPATTVILVVAAFVLYELILNAANNNPSIRTMLFVTNGFVFGLSLAVIIDFNRGWLSAIICLLSMAYKYMIAEATATFHSRSRNIFVILVNGFFYSAMFTVVECMAFQENTVVFVMIYVVSFAFFMCSYTAYKTMGPSKRRYPVYGNGDGIGHDMGSDWRHIVKRTVNYGRLLKDEFDDALDKSGDTFSGLIREIRKKVVPDYTDGQEDNDDIRKELDKYRYKITEIASREELTENELTILEGIIEKLDAIYHDYYKNNKAKLEYEMRINALNGDIEMLKNTISVRKEREMEDRMKEATQNRRSQAQQARRKREREEREKREEEERRARKEKDREQWEEEERRSAEEEQRRREEERQRQEKRRRERNTRAAGDSKGGNKGSDKVAGIPTRYFKGCKTIDDLSLRYKKLCLIYHPDSGSGDVDTYIELKDEYEMLKKRLS